MVRVRLAGLRECGALAPRSKEAHRVIHRPDPRRTCAHTTCGRPCTASQARVSICLSFGLFMGYLLPSENVMQVIGPVLAVFSLFGGLFVPVSLLPSVMQDIAPYMPTYWRGRHRALSTGGWRV